jgi:hypothetical protein
MEKAIQSPHRESGNAAAGGTVSDFGGPMCLSSLSLDRACLTHRAEDVTVDEGGKRLRTEDLLQMALNRDAAGEVVEKGERVDKKAANPDYPTPRFINRRLPVASRKAIHFLKKLSRQNFMTERRILVSCTKVCGSVLETYHSDGTTKARNGRDRAMDSPSLGSPDGIRNRRRDLSASRSDETRELDTCRQGESYADSYLVVDDEKGDQSNQPSESNKSEDLSGIDPDSENKDIPKNPLNSKAAREERRRQREAAEAGQNGEGQADATGQNENELGLANEKGQRHSYPPKTAKGNKSEKPDKPPLRSLFSIRPIFSGLWRYTMAAKILSFVLVFQNAVSVLGGRQITALVNLPSGGGTGSSSLAKRAAADELPFDVRYTHKWLAKMFGDSPEPILVLTLMFTWVSMCIIMSGVIYNAIIEKSENTPVVLSEEEKKAKWYRNKMLYVKKVGGWMKSCVISVVRLILMDRNPAFRHFKSKVGWWTGLRISIFTVQLLIAIVMVRHVLAMASLVAGAETPIPSGLEITLTLETLKKALPTIQPYPGGMMLLIGFVLTAVIIIVPLGWHSLLHPRQKNPQSRTAGQTIKRFLTCQAFGKDISLGRYRPVVIILLAIALFGSFGACLYYFVEIMAAIGEVGFIKDNGYMDSLGLVGASMIFGIFAPPLAYIGFECEDALRAWWKNRGSKTTDTTK